jgi:hypothetical protein
MAIGLLSKLKKVSVAVCASAMALALPASNGLASRAQSEFPGPGVVTGRPGAIASVTYETEAGLGCREASLSEQAFVGSHGPTDGLRDISEPRLQSESGLHIILRATPALDANPQAKAAFLRAAAAWEERIASPTTVIIDADFAPTWFGNEYPQGVMGFTNPQMLIAFNYYVPILLQLIYTASTPEEAALYQAMSFQLVPTDLGPTWNVLAPSALFRTLHVINSDPDTDPGHFGPPPAIGFNSNMSFDFDPSDGIDEGTYDFEGAVMHEIGHVLGFVSAVGQRELNPDCDLALTMWDLFRVRPGATLESFGTAERILSTGGAQVFFKGTGELQLSTGLPDSGSGDGLQPSHWRDRAIVGQRIGLMDPSLPPGTRQTIAMNDLSAADVYGYTLRPFGNNRPAVSTLKADLNGDVLSVAGSGTDADGDVMQAQATFLDVGGRSLAQTSPFPMDFGVTTTLAIKLGFPGMNARPEATAISLVLIDSRGNRSAPVTADFSAADPGGAKLSSASYSGGVLKLKGKRLSSDMQVEINGVLVAPPAALTSPSAKKLTLSGSPTALNIRAGANRIRVIGGGVRSNILVAGL